MLLSRDGTKAFVAVPKTGTNSVQAILTQFCGARQLLDAKSAEDWGIIFQRYHGTVSHNIRLIQQQFPHATVNNIAAYAFYRDPVERWCSAVNFFYKRQVWFLLDLKSVARNPRKLEMLADNTFTERFHEDQFRLPNQPQTAGSNMVKEFFSPEVVEEMANTPWENFPVNPDENEFFYPQSHWLKQPNTVILDYSKFNEELEWLVNEEWKGYQFYQKSNSTYRNTSEVKKLPVSESMRKTIMDAYHMDYDLTPHTIS